MKTRLLLTLVLLISVSALFRVYAQINFTSEPDTIAYVGLDYEYDADATGGVTKYELLEELNGMSINQSSGLLTWTPDSITDGGRVVIRASNVSESATQPFYIYLTDSLPCDTTMEAYWKLEEDGGPYDDFIGSNDAYAGASAPNVSTGRVGNGQQFNPVAPSKIDVPKDTVFNWSKYENFSIEFWFKKGIADFDSNAVMIGRNEGPDGTDIHWWIGFLNEGLNNDKVIFLVREYSGEAIAYGGQINDTLWHHALAIRDAENNNISLYIDGTTNGPETIDPNDIEGFISNDSLNIGYLRWEPAPAKKYEYPFKGTIDEIALYNKAFNVTEASNKWLYASSGKPACRAGTFGPVFRSHPDTIAVEEQAYSYTLQAHDPDGDPLTYSVVSTPSWLSDYNPGTKTLSGTPGNSDVGTELLSVKVNDGKVDVFQNINIRVSNTNDAPVINSTPVTSMDEEDDYSYQVTVNEIDPGDSQSYSVFSTPTAAWLSINGSGLLSGTAPLNDTAEYNLVIVVEDDSAATDTQRFVLDIMNINDAPVLIDRSPYQIDEDEDLVLVIDSLNYEDVDNGPADLTINILTGSNYTVAGNTISPVDNYHGDLFVSVELSDLSETGYDTLQVEVASVNDPPEFTSTASETAFEDQQYSYQFTATDVDTEDVGNLEFSVITKPDWLSYNPAINYLGGKPDFADIGTDTLTIRVTDGKDPVDQTTFITVNLTNHIPRITSSPVTSVDEDTEYLYNLVIVDEELEDPLFITAPVLPGWLNLNSGDKTLSGTPTNDQVGIKADSTYVIQLKVSDGKQDSTQTFTITVNNVNDAPVYQGQNDTILAYANQIVVIDIEDVFVEDVDNTDDELSVIPQPGSNYAIDGNVVDPNDGFSGLLEVNIKISDGELQSSTGKVYVRIFATSTGVETNKDGITYMVYPIPASNKIHFKLNTVLNGAILEIINLQGSTIYNTELVTGVETEIDVNELPDGVYIYKINHQQVVQTGKFVVTH